MFTFQDTFCKFTKIWHWVDFLEGVEEVKRLQATVKLTHVKLLLANDSKLKIFSCASFQLILYLDLKSLPCFNAFAKFEVF